MLVRQRDETVPRLGTSRAHAGCRPGQRLDQPEAKRRDQPCRI